MKYLLLLILTLTFVSAFANTSYAVPFLGAEPSSINLALGAGTGVVDIWHVSPLVTYSNPAIPSFHEGFSIGYTKMQLEYTGDSGFTYSSSLINIGYKGIGFTFPSLNGDNKMGIDLDYRYLQVTDSENHDLGTFHSYETGAVYGISANITRLILNHNHDLPFLYNFDIALGLNEVAIRSVLAPEGQTGTIDKDGATAWTTDLGAIVRYKHDWDNTVYLQALYGITSFNAFNSKINYTSNDAYADPIFSRLNDGYAVSLSLLSKEILKDRIKPKYLFFSDILSLRYLASFISDDNDKDIHSNGFEIGLLETFYYRTGNYNDKLNHYKVETKGYGFNLHYKNLIGFEYNHAETPAFVSLINSSDDYALRFDFISLYHAFK